MATRMMLNQDIDNTPKPEAKVEPAAAPAAPVAQGKHAEPQANNEDRYAHMFAAWDLLPPQVLIRRVTRRV